MKVCGYCNNEYNDAEPKCPVCGSTLLRHNKHSDPAEAELKRIKNEIERKRKSRSLIIGIGAAVIILAIVIAIFSIVGYVTDPQRDIAKESKELFTQAEQQVDNKDYDAAIDTLDQINPEWDDYADVEALKVEAVRSQLTTKVAEYQAAGNYQGIITFIKENVADINADSEIKAAYNSAVQHYVASVLAEANNYIGAGDYNSARTVLNTAVALIGEDVSIATKLAEIDNAALLETIAEYENSGDYISLVSFLQGVAANNGNYSALLNQYTQILVDDTLKRAQSYADSRRYEEAIGIINNVSAVYNCSEFEDAINEYEGRLPIKLIDAHLVTATINTAYSDYSTSGYDSFGNEYEKAIVLRTDRDCHFIYNIDNKYASLSGTIAYGNGGDWYDSPVAIRVYLDDKLIYETNRIEETTKPFAFSVDISGGSLLKVEYECFKDGLDGGSCVIDATLS